MHTEQLIQRLRAEFGSQFYDIRHLMPRHRTNYPRPVNFDELIGIAVHHTAPLENPRHLSGLMPS